VKKKLITKLFDCFIVITKKSNLYPFAFKLQGYIPKCNNYESPRGFTLVELLVVMAIIVPILIIVVGVTSSTLRGSNKTGTINNVRENGNYAISQMERVIKYAKSFDGVSVDGAPLSWSCQIMPYALTPTPIPIQYKYVKTTSFGSGQPTIFKCVSDTIYLNEDRLIDTGSVSLASGSCFFTCKQDRITDSPTLGINFTLKAKTTSPLIEQQASIPFTVSIKTRN